LLLRLVPDTAHDAQAKPVFQNGATALDNRVGMRMLQFLGDLLQQ